MKRILAIIILSAVVIGGGSLWWSNGILPVNLQNKNSVIFVVNKGDGIREIVNNLKSKGLIKNPIVFFLLVKKLGLDKKIEAGDFRLSPSMNANQIALSLTHGTLDLWITIPEGQRAGEITDALQKTIPSFKPSWKNALLLNEGYLFPDTYLIPKDADIDLIISIMKNNFYKKIQEIGININDPKLSQAIVIASLIEREARHSEDIPLVSSVIANRLNIGMKLDIDATIQYAIGYQESEKRWWKKNLTQDDLALKSPYNTYLNAGLPPTPISNPGIRAIQAALNPLVSDYLYYVSDRQGRLHFAKTLQQHNVNIRKYEIQ